MIEQAIYFALGCVVTALLALMFAPLFWRRALRLTRKRLQLQVPLSPDEIVADRDHLRAEHAIDRLRIEDAMARVQAGKDADMIAIGRHTVEAARLAEEVETLRKLGAAQTHQIELFVAARAEHEIENRGLRRDLGTAQENVERLRAEADDAAREHERLATEGEGHRESAAALVARIADMETAEATIAGLRADLEQAKTERERTRGAQMAAALKAEKDRAATAAATARIAALEAEVATLSRNARAGEPTPPGETAHRAPEPNPGADDDLRRSIHALGLAVAAMTPEAD